MWRNRASIWKKALALSALLALFVAGCGGGSDDDSASDGSAAVETNASESQRQGSVESPSGVRDKDIAFLNITRACEGCVRAEEAFKEAASEFGWNVRVVDGQGDPNRIADQFNTLLESGVDAIAMQSIDPAVVGGGLAKAEERGIPVVAQALGGGFDASYLGNGLTAVSDFNAVVESGLISEAFFAELNARHEGDEKAKIAVFTGTPSLSIHRLRYAGFQSFLKENKDKVEVVATHSTDLTKIESDVRNTMDSILTAHPDLAAVWTIQDLEALPVVEALRARDSADDTFVTTFIADKGIVENIREDGGIHAVVDSPVELNGYSSVDVLAKAFSGEDFSRRPSLTDVVAQPLLITRGNAPAEGEPVQPEKPQQAYVDAWKERYGL